MNEKHIEELFPVIVKSYNQKNYEYASMVAQFVYGCLEETKMKLSPFNIACVNNILKTIP